MWIAQRGMLARTTNARLAPRKTPNSCAIGGWHYSGIVAPFTFGYRFLGADVWQNFEKQSKKIKNSAISRRVLFPYA